MKHKKLGMHVQIIVCTCVLLLLTFIISKFVTMIIIILLQLFFVLYYYYSYNYRQRIFYSMILFLLEFTYAATEFSSIS